MVKTSIAKVKEMLLSGKTYEEVAKEFNTTKQNVHLWRKKWLPELTKKQFGKGFETNQRPLKERLNQRHLDEVSRAKASFFSRKKQNCKKTKHEFTLKFTDVDWVDVCPVLGIKIDWMNSTRADNSPSLDRIDSTKGYIAGNVCVVSWRANRIKNDGTAEEHLMIAEYIKQKSQLKSM